MSSAHLDSLGRHDSWEGVRAVVAGFGVSGFAAADNLTHLGALVTALDESDAGDRGDKATLLQILGAILRAGGLRSVACGDVGLPLVEAVMDPTERDVLAVELSSFQLHYTRSVACESAAVLNVAEDHLDWYSSMEDYAADKGRI